MVWSRMVYQGKEAHIILVGSSIVKMVGSSLGEGHTETHLRVVGECSQLSTKLSDWEFGPYEGIFVRGSNKD